MQLIELWEFLPRLSKTPQLATTLGYRGSYLKDGHGRTWHAYSGEVTLSAPDSAESRRDPDRNFETAILKSAPKGLVPFTFLDGLMRERLAEQRH